MATYMPVASIITTSFHDALATPPIMKVSAISMTPHPLPPPRGGGLNVLATLEITKRPFVVF